MADIEIKKDDLRAVAGGALAEGEGAPVIAYCKECGQVLECKGNERIDGGLTNIFTCTNSTCSNYQKKLTNLDVKWPD